MFLTEDLELGGNFDFLKAGGLKLLSWIRPLLSLVCGLLFFKIQSEILNAYVSPEARDSEGDLRVDVKV